MKQMRRTEKEDAVSPVIGVMLMLVVTIIIAAVVAAFAGGLASDTDAADSAIIKLDSYDMATVNQKSPTPWTTYTAGYKEIPDDGTSYGVYNMTFLHKGGDKLDVTKLRLGITYDGATEFTPLSKVTDVKSWGVGEKLVLTTGPEMMKEIGGTYNTYFGPNDGLFWGLSQQKLGAPGNSFEWMILDGSGNVIVKGTAFA